MLEKATLLVDALEAIVVDTALASGVATKICKLGKFLFGQGVINRSFHGRHHLSYHKLPLEYRGAPVLVSQQHETSVLKVNMVSSQNTCLIIW